MKQSTFIWISVAVNLIFIAGALYLLDHYRPLPPVGVHVPAEVAPQVAKVAKIRVIVKECAVEVHKPEAKAKVGLSQVDQTNPDKHVLAATTCKADNNPHTVVTTLNSTTGTTETTIRKDPLPWFAAKQSGYAGLSYGFKSGAGETVRLMAGMDGIQIKAFHLGVAGTLDSDGQAYAGAHIFRRF